MVRCYLKIRKNCKFCSNKTKQTETVGSSCKSALFLLHCFKGKLETQYQLSPIVK